MRGKNKKLKFKKGKTYSEFINHVRNPELRRIDSKFRIENHNLKIETGRFTIPKTAEDIRICDHCNLNSVENMKRTYYLSVIYIMI